MGEREIREKYGGKLAKAINRAIRAEVPGGNQALERLTELAGAARHSGWKDRVGRDTAEATAYFRHKKDVVDRMDAEVRKRWGVPADDDSGSRGGPRDRAAAPRRSTAPKAPRPRAKDNDVSRRTGPGARAGGGTVRAAGKAPRASGAVKKDRRVVE